MLLPEWNNAGGSNRAQGFTERCPRGDATAEYNEKRPVASTTAIHIGVMISAKPAAFFDDLEMEGNID
jgi:hypothetical protein